LSVSSYTVFTGNVTETPIAVQIKLYGEMPLYSEKDVHMSHVLFQPITNTAHSCTQCVTIVTQYTDISTIALVRENFTENLHVTGTVPVSPDKCKSRQQNCVQKVSPV